MTDIADAAAAIEAEHIARGLSRINAAIPAGVPGECEECGEDMPRLIHGRCAFCRDGRRHPFERTRPERASVSCFPPVKERLVMPHPAGTKTIGFAASGDLLTQIERRAGGSSISALVRDLVVAGLARPAGDPPPAAAPAGPVELAEISLADLLDEIAARVQAASAVHDLEARAIAAEAKLAAVTSALTGAAA